MMRLSGRLLVVLVVALCLASVVGCGRIQSMTGGTPSASNEPTDSSLKAWPAASDAMQKVASDTMLLSVGTGGLALADVPSSWNFTFFSPQDGHLYRVAVEHGTAQPPVDLGAAKASLTVTQTVDITKIKLGAADAVVKARGFAGQSVTVPKNVVVSGTFAQIPGAQVEGMEAGVWHITFASGTDLADAIAYDADMMTGQITAAKAK